MLKIEVGELVLGFPGDGGACMLLGLLRRAEKLGSVCQDPDVQQAYRDIWGALKTEYDSFLGAVDAETILP